MKKRIGIPMALLNYRFLPLWDSFFKRLGLETVISSHTNRKVLQDGLRNSVDEVCLPVKVFSGHVIQLMDKVDYIFIPRMASVEKGNFICCKFLGLPDVIKNSISGLPPLITIDVDLNRKSWRRSMYELGFNFTKNLILLECAYRQAWMEQLNFESSTKLNEAQFSQKDIEKKADCFPVTLGLLAHSYNIYDSYVNMNMVTKLNALGANVITPDMLPRDLLMKESESFSKDLYWTYGREIAGAASYLGNGKVDGIIVFISFGCGPDSLIGELIVRKLKKKLPVMMLVFDEGTAEAGLMTRLESFTDMVKRRKCGGLSL